MTPLVVGVNHDNNVGTLLDKYAQERFAEKICPLIDNQTIIFLEGRYHRPIFWPTHKKYRAQRWCAECALGVELPNSPAIAWRDGRYFPFHRAATGELAIDLHRDVVSSIPQPGLTAKTLAGALRRIEDGLMPHASKRNLSRLQHIMLWNHAKEIKEFDRRAIAGAKKYMDTHRVIIVSGAVHAIAIARSQGWNRELLIKDTREESHDLIREYHVSYILPQCYPRPADR